MLTSIVTNVAVVIRVIAEGPQRSSKTTLDWQLTPILMPQRWLLQLNKPRERSPRKLFDSKRLWRNTDGPFNSKGSRYGGWTKFFLGCS